LVACRGVTKDNAGQYYLILDEMKQNLSDFVHSSQFNRNEVYTIGQDISKALNEIKPNVHGNLHFKNILQRFDGKWVVSELGSVATSQQDDVSSFGDLLYYILTQQYGRTAIERLPMWIPTVLRDFISRCWCNKVSERPTITELLELFNTIEKIPVTINSLL
jgi:hypothetical protein